MIDYICSPIITLLFIIVIAFLETILANCVSVYIINSKLPKPLLSSEYNNTIWKILGCCFLAESISMVILSILFPVILGESIKYAVQNSVILLIYMITTGTNYSNLQSILFTISTIFLSSVIIFLLCRFFIFKNLDLLEKKKRYSLLIAIMSAPYFLLIPFENKRDLEEIPDNVIADLDIHPVKRIEEVLTLALQNEPSGMQVVTAK